MKSIPIGVLGEILAGTETGRFVELLNDSNNTGGFIIVTYADSARSPEVFDMWVESLADVAAGFDELGWTVRWQSTGPAAATLNVAREHEHLRRCDTASEAGG